MTRNHDGWWGGQNMSQDQSGEYVPCSGYSYTKELFRSDVIAHMRGPELRVRAELRLWGGRKRWSLSISDGGWRNAVYPVRGARCKSIQDAKRLADALLSDGDWVGDVFRRYYSRRCIVSTRDGAPFCTMFDEDFFYLPVGEYVAEFEGARLEVKRWAGGYGSGSLPRSTEVA